MRSQCLKVGQHPAPHPPPPPFIDSLSNEVQRGESSTFAWQGNKLIKHKRAMQNHLNGDARARIGQGSLHTAAKYRPSPCRQVCSLLQCPPACPLFSAASWSAGALASPGRPRHQRQLYALPLLYLPGSHHLDAAPYCRGLWACTANGFPFIQVHLLPAPSLFV